MTEQKTSDLFNLTCVKCLAKFNFTIKDVIIAETSRCSGCFTFPEGTSQAP